MAFYLGIDGGGTKTTCAVGDESKMLAMVTTGPSNIVRVGEAITRESLHQAVKQACAAAGISAGQLRRVCIGVAGAGRVEIAALISNILVEVVTAEIEVLGDGATALEAAFGAGPGIVVIAGTGSIAYGRSSKGTIARAGGWGFAVSDEGSAHWIGRAAIAALLRARDEDEDQAGPQAGRQQSRISRLEIGVGETWGSAAAENLVRSANATPPPDFAALCPAVISSAEAGETLSRQVLAAAGVELARIASIVMGKLFPAEPSQPSRPSQPAVFDHVVPLAMAGGVFRHAALVRESFYNEIREVHPQAALHPQVVEPVNGALQLARRSGALAASE